MTTSKICRSLLVLTLATWILSGCAPGGSSPGPTQEEDDGPDATPTPEESPGSTATPQPTSTPQPQGCEPGSAPDGFPTTDAGVEVGQTPPDFTDCVQDADGTEHNLYGHLGEVVLISMGAGWCPPCQGEAPDIEQLYETYADQGFTVLMGLGEGWSSGSDPDATFVGEWSSTYGLSFPVFGDDTWMLSQYYASGDEGYIPLNVIVDRSGVVIYNGVGALPVGSATTLIENALAQPNPWE